MSTARVPPVVATSHVSGATVNVATPPAWVTTTVLPAMTTLHVRAFTLGVTSAVSVSVPVPVPPATLDVTQAHGDTTVHVAVLAVVVTVTTCVPPAAATFHAAGLTVLPACVTVITLPATVTVPTRAVTSGLACAVTVTPPLPTPLAALSVRKGTALVAVQGASPRFAVMVTACVPPDTPGSHVSGATVKLGTPAACVTVTSCPASVTGHGRVFALGVATAVSVTVAVPVAPALSAVSQSQVPGMFTVHAVVPGVTVTVNICVPPAAGGNHVAGSTVTVAPACV